MTVAVLMKPQIALGNRLFSTQRDGKEKDDGAQTGKAGEVKGTVWIKMGEVESCLGM